MLYYPVYILYRVLSGDLTGIITVQSYTQVIVKTLTVYVLAVCV